MTWMITKDYIDTGAEGLKGRGFKEPEEGAETVQFRMYDDDEELYYEGIMLLGPDQTGFEPLDDFGEPNAGCTEIRVWEGDEWKPL